MKVTAYKTDIVTPGSHDLFELLDAALPELAERSVVAVASKVVALCERRVVPKEGTNLRELVIKEAEQYMPEAHQHHGYTFTIAHNMLTPNSGIDESNAAGQYVLWPADPQASANALRKHLCERFNLQDVGVVITDGNFIALRWGTIGLALAYSGFQPVNRYADKVDLFGRPLLHTRTNVMDSLATTATLLMGEGNEQTPLVVIKDVPSVVFQRRNPTTEELANLRASLEEDSYAPMLLAMDWKPGGRQPSGD